MTPILFRNDKLPLHARRPPRDAGTQSRQPRINPDESPVAVYATTPQAATEAERAAGALPPLGVKALEHLVVRFEEKWPHEERKAFDPADFVRSVNAHLESTRLRPASGVEKEPNTSTVVVHNQILLAHLVVASSGGRGGG